MKTALVTGFEAFGKYVVNPTEILAKELNGKKLAGHRIKSLIIPTTILSPTDKENHVGTILSEALSVGASVIISLGIVSDAKGVRIEHVSKNWIENDRYCTIYENRKPVMDHYLEKETQRLPFGKWDLPKIFQKLALSGIPFEPAISEDAGSYCCNALMYSMLRMMRTAHISIPFIFAHVPCTEGAVVEIPDFDRKKKILIKQQQLVEVVKIMLESYWS